MGLRDEVRLRMMSLQQRIQGSPEYRDLKEWTETISPFNDCRARDL